MTATSNFRHRVYYALKHSWVKFLEALGCFLSISAIIPLCFPDFSLFKGWTPFIIIVSISFFIGIITTWKPSRIEIKIPHTNTTVEVFFGDLFTQDGLKATPVSEFFDSEIGLPVSEKTLHGIFIKKCLGGYSASFDSAVENTLSEFQHVDVPEKSKGKKKLYPIGTTALIPANDGEYLAFALSKTEPKTCKAYCDVAIMWKALDGLWEKGRTESGGKVINVPLIGSGQSGIGLTARDLINLIILSAIKTTQRQQIAPTIRMILQNDRFEELDLRSIKKYWEE